MEQLIHFDQHIFSIINGRWHNDLFDVLMPFITDKYTWIPVYALIIWFAFRKFKGSHIAIVLVCLLLTVFAADRLTSGLIKPMVSRKRPCIETSMHARSLVACNDTGSFPSSHAANHFAIAVFMILTFGHRWRSVISFTWLFWAFLIAYSRVYVGVHYPLDVITGGILGSLIGFACFKLNLQLQKHIKP